MATDIRALQATPAAEDEAARLRPIAVHHFNFEKEGSVESSAWTEAEEPEARFHRLRNGLVSQGLPEAEARTEVARIVARELWDRFASQLRHHRAAGHHMDANVLAVALGAIQCMVVPLARHRSDEISAGIAVRKARGRLQHNGGLMDRLHTHANPAFKETDVILQSLEDFLARPRPKASAAGHPIRG